MDVSFQGTMVATWRVATPGVETGILHVRAAT
jgi:hypothetical protein